MQLKTKRLVLREPRLNDAPTISQRTSTLRIAQYLSEMPLPNTEANVRKFLRLYAKQRKQKPRAHYLFAITLKKKKEVVGLIGIHNISAQHQKATFGYWLAETHWGQGLMSEAVKAIVQFCFTRLKLRRMQAEVFKPNKASIRVLEKNGFRREGLQRQSHKIQSTGKVHDAYWYGLLREDWHKT